MCFECRADMPDALFSRTYLKMLDITIAVEMTKKHDAVLTNDQLGVIVDMLGTPGRQLHSRQHKRVLTTAPDHDITYQNHNKNIPCGL